MLRGLIRTVESLELLLVVVVLLSLRRERLEFHDDGLEESWDALSTDRQLALAESPEFLATYQQRAAGEPSLALTAILAGLAAVLAGEQLLRADTISSLHLAVIAATLATIRGLRLRHRFARAGADLARLMA